MRSQESPPTIGTLVKNHLDEMASGIQTAHTSCREGFSYKRLQPVLDFTPASFNDGRVFSKWLSEQFCPRMVHLRVEKGLAIESLRENCGHLAKWMLLHGVPPLMIDQFKAFVSIKRGRMWRLLVEDMDETSSVQGDEVGLLSSKVVDVPRFELGASTMPR